MLRKVMKDSAPTMLAVLFYSLYGVMDGLFVGNATGDIGLAAVNIGWPIVAFIMAIGVGIGSGGSVLISYYRGKSDKQTARIMYVMTVKLLVLGGVILWLFLLQYENILWALGARSQVYIEAINYTRIFILGSVMVVLGSGMLPVLRNIGMAFEALLCMVVGVVLNVLINYYLMMVMDMGVKGAAYGTIISQSIVVAMVFLCIKKSSRNVFRQIDVQGAFITEPITRKQQISYACAILQAGVTPFGIYIAPSITLIFTNLQCLAYGGDTVVASYAVISYIVFPVLSLLGGVGDGTQPLISYYFGGKKEKELKEIRNIALGLLVIISIVAMMCTISGTTLIARCFGLSEAASNYFSIGMKVSAIAFLGQGFTKFLGVYLNATMQSKFAVTLTYVESLVISPCVLCILPFVCGVMGIWLAPSVTACVMLLIYWGKSNIIKWSKKYSMIKRTKIRR